MLIWAISAETQSPYVSAKALVIASPLLLALAVLPLVERRSQRLGIGVAIAAVAIGLGALVVRLRRAGAAHQPGGPDRPHRGAASVRTMLADRPTLFLGHDDYITWELAGVPLGKVVHGGVPSLPTRPQKLWEYGEPVDFGSVEPHILNEFEWFVAPRDPAASAPPPQLRLVRQTESYSVWRRVRRDPARPLGVRRGQLFGQAARLRDSRRPRRPRAGRVAGVRPQPVVAFGDTTYAVWPGSSIRPSCRSVPGPGPSRSPSRAPSRLRSRRPASAPPCRRTWTGPARAGPWVAWSSAIAAPP